MARRAGNPISEYQVPKREHRECQRGSRQNCEYAPVPDPRTRFRQPQHVKRGVGRTEVARVLSVSGSVRHEEMLALKNASFWGKSGLLVIQNSTDKTHIQSCHKGPLTTSATPSSVVPMFHGDHDFPARVPVFHVADSLSRVAQPVRLVNDGSYFAGQD